jgi:hypothetical protein
MVTPECVQDLEEVHVALFDNAVRRHQQLETVRRLHGARSPEADAAETAYRRARRVLGMFPGEDHHPKACAGLN